MTETMVRTYTVGQAPIDDYAWRENAGTWCREPINGFVCSIRRGHEGPQHVAANSLRVVAVKDREGWVPTSIEEVVASDDQGLLVPDELDAFKGRVRKLAHTICASRGYGTWESWNATMVKLGLTPFEQRVVRVVAPVQRVAFELADRLGEEQAQEWLNARRYRLADYLRPVQEEMGEPSIEVTADVPGVDGVEPLPDAATSDLDTYRDLVRRVAIEMAADESWCDDGLNGVLDELGLRPKGERYRVTVTVRAERLFTAVVEADDGDQAWRAVDNMSADELREALSEYDPDQLDVLDDQGWSIVSQDASTRVHRAD